MLSKFIHFSICLIVFCLPFYLLRLKIWWIPTTVLELMIYAVFVLWLIFKISNKVSGFRFQVSGYEYPILFIFLGATISTLFSSNIQVSAGLWKAYFLDPLLFLLVLVDTIKTKQQLKDIIAAFSLSGLAVAIVGLWYWFNGELTYDGRLAGFYLSPNHLAMYIAPALLFFTYFLLTWPKKKNYKYLFLIFCLLPFAFCLFKTYSYGAWLGVIGALIFLAISKYYRLFWLVSFILLLIILSIFYPVFKDAGQDAQQPQNSVRPSLESRLIIWQVAGEIIKDHPLIGIGPGLFQKYYLAAQPKFEPYLEWAVPQPHNIFFAFWLQTGLLGLIGFIWLLVIFFSRLRGHSPLLKGNVPGATILGAVMIYILIHGLIDTPFWKNDLAMIFWLIIALSMLNFVKSKQKSPQALKF